MTIDELMSMAEKYNFGEGVPVDYEKAAYYYEQAAELGDAVAQYNLGLKFDRGTGVPRDNAKCHYWMQKAAEQGYAPAEKYLSLCEQEDLGNNVVISNHMLKGVSMLYICGARPTSKEAKPAKAEFAEALKRSLALNFPTESHLAKRREIYRYLGYTEYLSGTKEQAYEYYKRGLPISESDDEQLICSYLSMVESMRGQSEYGIAFCQAIEDVYHNAFAKITDIDYKTKIMRWAVREKSGIYKKPRDIAGAEQINALLLQYAIKQEEGTLTCSNNLREFYKANLNSISNGKRAVGQEEQYRSNYCYNYTSSDDVSPRSRSKKSFWQVLFPLSFGTVSLAGLSSRIVIYLLVGIVSLIFSNGFIGLIGLIGVVYAIAGCIVTVLAHTGVINE